MVEPGVDDPLRVARHETGFAQGVDLFLHILHQLDGKLHGEILPRHDALHHHVLQVGGHRIRGYEPAVHAQPVGQVVQRPFHVGIVLQAPAHDGDVGRILVDVEDAHALKLFGQVARHVERAQVDLAESLESIAHEHVVLPHDLRRAAREVDGHSGLLAA